MRKITIHQESSVIEVLDDDDSELETYCKELSKLFEAGNISILKTSNTSVILRPSKITGVVVESLPSDSSNDTSCEKEQKTEDIIMDVN